MSPELASIVIVALIVQMGGQPYTEDLIFKLDLGRLKIHWAMWLPPFGMCIRPEAYLGSWGAVLIPLAGPLATLILLVAFGVAVPLSLRTTQGLEK